MAISIASMAHLSLAFMAILIASMAIVIASVAPFIIALSMASMALIIAINGHYYCHKWLSISAYTFLPFLALGCGHVWP